MFLVCYGSKTFSVHLAIMFWVKGIILSYFYYLQGWRNDRHDKLCRSFYKPNCETRGFWLHSWGYIWSRNHLSMLVVVMYGPCDIISPSTNILPAFQITNQTLLLFQRLTHACGSWTSQSRLRGRLSSSFCPWRTDQNLSWRWCQSNEALIESFICI